MIAVTLFRRVARSVGVALLALIAVVAVGLASTVASAVQLLASTALVMSGTFTPTPSAAFVRMAKDQFIVPTHPGQAIGPYYAITTPEQAWPVTGLFDYPFGTSVRIGQQDLEAAMALYGNDNLIIFGHSQSSVIAFREKARLAALYPEGTPAPNIQFVTIGTLNLPNGGVMTRFWGGYLPFVDFYFNGPAPTDTQFHTDIITQRWDGFADFPIYPINLLAVLNAVAGIFYVHEEYDEVTLAGDPSKYFAGSHGDTDYYFFETQNLPLFGPLRSLGVPEALIDVVEPITTFLVELGYRRDIPLWVPSPARLIPVHNPVTVLEDFVAAVGQTIDNTRALFSPPRPAAPAPITPAPAKARSVAPPEPVAPVSDLPSDPDPVSLSTPSDTSEAETAPEPERVVHTKRPLLPSSTTSKGPRFGDYLHRGSPVRGSLTERLVDEPTTAPTPSSPTEGVPGDDAATTPSGAGSDGSAGADGAGGGSTTDSAGNGDGS
jgi:hypothetical protein